MPQVSLKADFSDIQQYLEDTERNRVPSVATSTLNTKAREGRNEAMEALSTTLGVPTAVIRRRIKLTRANRTTYRATVYVYKRNIGWKNLNPVQQGRKPGRPPGARKGQRTAPAGGVTARKIGQTAIGAFPISKAGVDNIIVRRKGKNRTPVATMAVPLNKTASVMTPPIFRKKQREWPQFFLRKLATALEQRGSYRSASFVREGIEE